MLERELKVSNRLGLHARAAAKLVQLLSGFKSQVTLTGRGREVNAKSIMGVLLLAAAPGASLLIRAEGEDEEAALQAAADLFDRRFDEDG
jgi:phosphocarrier protein